MNTTRRRAAHRGRHLLAWLLTLSAVMSAASPGALRWQNNAELDTWLDETLIPYTVETLSQHPRFKDQSVQIVGVERDVVHPEMDDLRRAIAQRMRQVMRRSDHVRLMWHEAGTTGIDCGPGSAPDYYLALEIAPIGEQRYRVELRILDVHERIWLGGFGRSWQGRLDARQRNALARNGPVNAVQGQRTTPFSETQVDLMARSIAQQLARNFCGHVGEPLIGWLQMSDDDSPLVAKTLRLVGHYLANTPDVRLTTENRQANIVIDARIVHIDASLYQFWVSVRPRRPEAALPQLDTDAYVTLTTPLRREPPQLADARSDSSPASIAQRTRARPALLASITVIAPATTRQCRHPNPWADGAPTRAADNVIDPNGCFALELGARRDSKVFLLRDDAHAGLIRLLPSACPTYGRVGGVIARGSRLRFPSPISGARHVLHAPGYPAQQTFHAIAVSDHDAAAVVQHALAGLRDACSAAQAVGDHAQRQRAHLQAIVADLGERAQWRSVNVRYTARASGIATRDRTRRNRHE